MRPDLDTLPTEALAQMLADGPTDAERCAAAAALGSRGGDEATAALVGRLQHRISSTVSDACADALAAIGAPALPALSHLAADRGAGIYAARALRQIGEPEATQALVAYEDEKTVIKAEAVFESSRDGGESLGIPRRIRLPLTIALAACGVVLVTTGEGPLGWVAIGVVGALLALESLVVRRYKQRWFARMRRYLSGYSAADGDPEMAYFVAVLEDPDEEDVDRSGGSGSE